MNGWLIALIIVAVLGAGGGIGWSYIAREHREARSLPLDAVDFSKLEDGTFHGVYEGGIYKWRTNECEVTVQNGKVTDIRLASSKDPGGENADFRMLYDRVITAQSLQVDTITGATLTSKAYLQAVENALVESKRE